MKKDDKEHSIINAGLAGSQAETVQRYGSAVKEHIVAYTGEDHEAGKELAKGLKSISGSKINPNDTARNIKQQAGFSAEVKTEARENAEKIIHGDKVFRSSRTDDMVRQPDGKGRTIGGKNEQLYDIAEIDRNGIYIEGSGRQLKYVGGNAEECYRKLLGGKYDKYRDADVPIEIPSDFYEEVREKLNDRINSLEHQINNAEAKGNYDLAERHRTQLEKARKTRDTLRKGQLTNDEAIEARLHPVLSTAKDVTKVSHQAGMESAKYGVVIGGGISIVQNLVAVVKNEKGVKEAVLDVAKDTVSTAAISYGTGFTGSAIKGVMQSAKSQSAQVLAKTNLPGIVVTVAMGAAKTMKRYYNGEINGVECFEELGEQGTGMLSSALFSAIGQIAIPIPIIGGLIGGMLGYAVSSASYSTLLNALKEADCAHEERVRIEQECEQQIQLIKEYRKEIESLIGEYLSRNMTIFQESFDGIKNTLSIGDVDGFILSANAITQSLGKEVLLHSICGLDDLMENENTIKF